MNLISNIANLLREYRFRRKIMSLVNKGMKIGRNVHVMPGVFFDEDYACLISIGDNCRIADGVRILAHDASMYPNLGFAKIGRIDIKKDSFIGVNAIIMPGVTIGPNAIVGAGCVVSKDVPENSVVAGNPAKVIMTKDEFLKSHKEKNKTSKIFQYAEFVNKGQTLFNQDSDFKTAYLQGGVTQTNLSWLDLKKDM